MTAAVAIDLINNLKPSAANSSHIIPSPEHFNHDAFPNISPSPAPNFQILP